MIYVPSNDVKRNGSTGRGRTAIISNYSYLFRKQGWYSAIIIMVVASFLDVSISFAICIFVMLIPKENQ